jgi:hypothetical protein
MLFLFLALNTTNTLFLDLCKQLPGKLPRSNTEDSWRSVDTHYQDEAGSMLLFDFLQKPANTSFINSCNQSPHRLHIMHSQTNLMSCRRLFPECVSDCGIYSLWLAWLPVHWLWIAATRWHLNDRTLRTKNHWLSIDAYFLGGASVSNSSGPSLWVWVRVQTELLSHWGSRLSIFPNRQQGYSVMVRTHPARIRCITGGWCSRSIYGFILGTCFCSLWVVSYQNHVFNNK